MFTGIVRGTGTVESVTRPPGGEGCSVRIGFPDDARDWQAVAQPGASVAVDGVCLTSTGVDSTGFSVDVSEESLEKTTLSGVESGRSVNLEPSLRVGDEIGGHFVFGHVDTTVPIRTLQTRGDFYELQVEIPRDLRGFVAPKGSVALDGISLTINEVSGGILTLRIIPYTYENTALSTKAPGDRMNLEVDMLARYVYTNLAYEDRESDPLSPTDLADAGFFPGSRSGE